MIYEEASVNILDELFALVPKETLALYVSDTAAAWLSVNGLPQQARSTLGELVQDASPQLTVYPEADNEHNLGEFMCLLKDLHIKTVTIHRGARRMVLEYTTEDYRGVVVGNSVAHAITELELFERGPATYGVKVLADSTYHSRYAPPPRLTTFQMCMPRILLAELNTHRVFARCSASSRAIPVSRRIKAVSDNPYRPLVFGRNQKGMQSSTTLNDVAAEGSLRTWNEAARDAVRHAAQLDSYGLHKQHANRVIEPYAWHTVVVTATEYENFFGLRTELQEDGTPLAQPEFHLIAMMTEFLYEQHSPRTLELGQWHLPYVRKTDLQEAEEFLRAQTSRTFDNQPLLAKVSAARSARTSYQTQGDPKSVQDDLDLYERLVGPGHLSPLEHTATPYVIEPHAKHARIEVVTGHAWIGPFRGWVPLRKLVHGEAVHVPRFKGHLLA